MGFIAYKRHIPHLYCRRVILNLSSAPEGLVMDLLPGSKTLRSLQSDNGVRRFLSIPTSLLDTQKAEAASAYQFAHGVPFIAFSLVYTHFFVAIAMSLQEARHSSELYSPIYHAFDSGFTG